jgi:hypothetical protein
MECSERFHASQIHHHQLNCIITSPLRPAVSVSASAAGTCELVLTPSVAVAGIAFSLSPAFVTALPSKVQYFHRRGMDAQEMHATTMHATTGHTTACTPAESAPSIVDCATP